MKMLLSKLLDQLERIRNHDKEATIDFQATITWAGAEVVWPPHGEILPDPPTTDRAKLWDSGVQLCAKVQIKRGQVYRHHKGKLVVVEGLGMREVNAEPHVVYREVDGGPVLIFRPLSEWWQLVVHEGLRVNRFKLHAETMADAGVGTFPPGTAALRQLADLIEGQTQPLKDGAMQETPHAGPIPVGETP